jgi:hypothetical protein
MTLVELLVAFMVFSLLITALVTLTNVSLDGWSRGEQRKDIYDRALILLDTITNDLRNAYSENEVFFDGQQELQPAAFLCDFDANRQQRLRFVRTGTPRMGRVTLGSDAAVKYPAAAYGDLWETAYVMDTDPEKKSVLWKAVRPFDRRAGATLLRTTGYDRQLPDLFRPLEKGVLHIGFRFWTQYTTTWDDKAQIRQVGPSSRAVSGPEVRWDSTRMREKAFHFHKKEYDRENPDFVYPEIVQVTVVLESTVSAAEGLRLAEECNAAAASLRLNGTQGLPDAPALVKVGAEWIEYGGKTLTELTNLTRGQRGTPKMSHLSGTPVRFGETFSTEVRIPAFREAQEP